MTTTKEITIYDIAKALEISPSTVSRALSSRTSLVHKETVTRIREKAHELGYRQNVFASRLRSQRTYMIGALVSWLNAKSIAGIVSGAEIVARQSGYSLVLYQSMDCWDEYASIINTLSTGRLEGMLVTRTSFLHPEQFTLQNGIPYVVTEEVSLCDRADAENTTSDTSYTATMNLVSRNCRRILFVYTSPKISYNSMLNGYRKALADSKITSEFICCGFDFEEKQFWDDIITSASPDGIILASEMIASFSIHNRDTKQQIDHTTFFNKTERSDFIAQNNAVSALSFNERCSVETGKVATSLLIALIEKRRGQQELSFK